MLAEPPGSRVVPLDATHTSGRHADGATPHAGKRQLGSLEGPSKPAVSFTASGSSFIKNPTFHSGGSCFPPCFCMGFPVSLDFSHAFSGMDPKTHAIFGGYSPATCTCLQQSNRGM